MRAVVSEGCLGKATTVGDALEGAGQSHRVQASWGSEAKASMCGWRGGGGGAVQVQSRRGKLGRRTLDESMAARHIAWPPCKRTLPPSAFC